MNRRITDRPRDIDETVSVEIEGIPADLRILAERDDGIAIVCLMVRISRPLLAMLATGEDWPDDVFLLWQGREYILPCGLDRLYITRGWWELHRAHELEDAAIRYLSELDASDRQAQQDAAAEAAQESRAERGLLQEADAVCRTWAKANGVGV